MRNILRRCFKLSNVKLRLWPLEARAHALAPYFSLCCLAFFTLTLGGYTLHVQAKTEQAAMCLAENLYHEGRGERRENLYLLGMLTLARVSDPDPQWPKTICGTVAQAHQFSWTLDYKLATQRSEQKKWEEAKYVARDLLRHAWNGYVLPNGWECARFYKRTDGRGVSKVAMRFFEQKLFPVGSFGQHTAYQERRGCKNPLPTN
jgi:spore germination cell wall hydrolase CwlJ-like protein